jgi:hypothetical protein
MIYIKWCYIWNLWTGTVKWLCYVQSVFPIVLLSVVSNLSVFNTIRWTFLWNKMWHFSYTSCTRTACNTVVPPSIPESRKNAYKNDSMMISNLWGLLLYIRFLLLFSFFWSGPRPYKLIMSVDTVLRSGVYRVVLVDKYCIKARVEFWTTLCNAPCVCSVCGSKPTAIFPSELSFILVN